MEAKKYTSFESVLESVKPAGALKDSRYEVAGTAAYLLGVREDTFENYPQQEVFRRLKLDKNARIIRNLCTLRTAIIRNYRQINIALTREFRLFENLGKAYFIPEDAMKELKADGIKLNTKVRRPSEIIVQINRLLTDRINNIRYLFPDFVKFDYIKAFYLMPNGLSEAGTKVAAELYYANKEHYTYQQYYHWEPRPMGNIFLDDKRFVTFLYESNNDYFADLNKVTDADSDIKDSFYAFVEGACNLTVFVDCENADAYAFLAALHSLAADELRKISKIILFDDVHTTPAWAALQNFVDIPVEHIVIDRIHTGKSLVDSQLMIRACQEHYMNHIDSILIVASDSDYWSMISSMKTARFFAMIESEKTSPVLKAGLEQMGVPYCYLNDFYAGGGDALKHNMIDAEIERQLAACAMDLEALLRQALCKTRASMSPTEQERYLEKLGRRLALRIDEDMIHLELKR
ncbi:MAG: hypothetical protein IIY00_05150 [Clostridia bacterium]|nr:hypothetical protein [Clostridia bacterium]